MSKRSRSARAWITALALGPGLALLIAGAASLGGSQLETSCWILPNARVLLASINPDCPLHQDDLLTAVIHDGTRIPFDSDARANWGGPQVDGMAIVEVMNSGLRQSRSLPLRHIDRWEQLERLLSALLLFGLSLAIPLCILWTSTAPAATPIALTYGLVAVVGVGAIIGRNSPGLTSAAVLAASAAPSVLLHLALVFPRKRAIVRAAHDILRGTRGEFGA